jgi:hypothetical protein
MLFDFRFLGGGADEGEALFIEGDWVATVGDELPFFFALLRTGGEGSSISSRGRFLNCV